jgi:hypothetical protein
LGVGIAVLVMFLADQLETAPAAHQASSCHAAPCFSRGPKIKKGPGPKLGISLACLFGRHDRI